MYRYTKKMSFLHQWYGDEWKVNRKSTKHRAPECGVLLTTENNNTQRLIAEYHRKNASVTTEEFLNVIPLNFSSPLQGWWFLNPPRCGVFAHTSSLFSIIVIRFRSGWVLLLYARLPYMDFSPQLSHFSFPLNRLMIVFFLLVFLSTKCNLPYYLLTCF